MFQNIEDLSNEEVNKIWKDLKKISANFKTKKSRRLKIRQLLNYSQNIHNIKSNTFNKLDILDGDIKSMNDNELSNFISDLRRDLTKGKNVNVKREKLKNVFEDIKILSEFIVSE